MKIKESAVTNAFETDHEAIYIDFELDEGRKFESLSYISLRARTFEFKEKNRNKVTLHFDQASVEIFGIGLKPLYDSIGKHNVAVVRKGRSDNETEPSVTDIKFTTSNKAIIG